jgi:hypothetical protein
MNRFDWAIAGLGAGPEVVAGGVSMGVDVAVALADVDERVALVDEGGREALAKRCLTLLDPQDTGRCASDSRKRRQT